ncbi:MAG: POTRA domain-containing protein [Gemmatimonadales bacterium]
MQPPHANHRKSYLSPPHFAETPLRHLLLVGFLLGAPHLLRAQADSASEGGSGDAPLLVRRIEIQRQDIFDSTEAKNWFTRAANRLHVVTRSSVIRREVLLNQGEPFDSARAAESERNLRRLGIFRDVKVDSVRSDSGLDLRVVTRDGWSTRLALSFRSTGGQATYSAQVLETNLLGTATQVLVRYGKTPDRTSTQFGFARSRLFAHTVGLAFRYEDRSDGNGAAVSVDYPFFSLSSRRALRIDAGTFKGRVLRFFDGNKVARDTLERRLGYARAEGALALRAGTGGYVRLGLDAQVLRDDFVPEAFTGSVPRTVTGSAGPFLELSRARFLVTRGFQNFARDEDVDISTTARLQINAAPEAWGYARGGVGPAITLRTGARLPRGFVALAARASGLYTSAGLDSGSVGLAGTVTLQPGRRHLVILHADAGWLKNPVPGGEFDLGLEVGPRAFKSHAFTGDRTFFTTAEYRWTIVPELWRLVGIGVAGFVDHGGAWYVGSKRRTGTDAGLGLRLGSSREADVQAGRIDLARRFANDVEKSRWVLVVGKGFVF